jgi:putative DNA primase/helicase
MIKINLSAPKGKKPFIPTKDDDQPPTGEQLKKLKAIEREEMGLKPKPQPQPLPSLTRPTVESFRPALLPEMLCRFVYDVAQRMSSPPDFVAIGMLIALGAALGNKLTMRPKAFDPFSLPANLWGGIIGDPSQKKTPSLSAAMAPLAELDSELKTSNSQILKDHSIELERHKLKIEIKKKEARKDGAYSFEPPIEPEQPPQPRLVVNNATSEKLGEIATDSPGGVLLFRDELAGWMAELERSGREGERAFFLEGWNGLGSYTFDRIGRGTLTVETLCLSILGGIQPGPFSSLLKAEGNSKKADGLLQRFSLLTWPDSVPFEYVDRSPDRAALDGYRDMVKRFHGLNGEGLDVGQSDDLGPRPFLRFDAKAQAAYISWLGNFMERIRLEDMPEAKAAHLAKYQKTLPVLALLFELAESRQPTSVGLESWQRAEAWGTYLESHLGRVYPNTAPALLAAHTIAGQWDCLPESFTAKDIYGKGWQGLTQPETVNAALSILSEYDWLTSTTSTTDKGGRPSTSYRKNITEPLK